NLVAQQQALLFGGAPPAPPPAALPTPPPVPAPAPLPPPPGGGEPRRSLPATPPAARPAPAPSANGLAAADVPAILLAVVAEKTGYPAEMLDLSMALDADLGIDSIKRVEILSALQEKLPHAPQVKPEHLGSLHTLKDVADFLAGGGGGPPRAEDVEIAAALASSASDGAALEAGSDA